MNYLRFLLLDVAGVLITVPLSIWLGRVFGGSVEELHRRMGNLHLVLAFALVSLLLVILVRIWVGRRWRSAPPSPTAGSSPPEAPPD
jgi:membrane protein DedA with SNARE-associated domain